MVAAVEGDKKTVLSLAVDAGRETSSPPPWRVSVWCIANLLLSLLNTCEDFLVYRNLVKRGEFFTTNPGENTRGGEGRETFSLCHAVSPCHLK